jgi:hypothetical protein
MAGYRHGTIVRRGEKALGQPIASRTHGGRRKTPQVVLRPGLAFTAACQASMNARARELTSSTRIPGL